MMNKKFLFAMLVMALVLLFVSCASSVIGPSARGFWNETGEIPIIIVDKPAPQEIDFSVLLSRAQAGDVESQIRLAYVFYDNYGDDKYRVVFSDGKKRVPVDYFQAFEWFKKAADRGNTEAMYQIGSMYQKGQIGPMEINYDRSRGTILGSPNYDKTMEWYMKAANLNYAPAQIAVAIIHTREVWNGRKVTPNYTEAVNWYKRAADNGSIAGMSSLMWLYKEGRKNDQGNWIFQPDVAEAKTWNAKIIDRYKEEAGNGNGNAMIGLMGIYKDGIRDYQGGWIVVPNAEEAKIWYTKALALGDVEIIFALAEQFERIDRNEGLRLYRAAAEHNHPRAQIYLGVAGGKGNKEENAMWFRRAGENGIPLDTSSRFSTGYFAKKDIDEANRWNDIAMESANARAKSIVGGFYYNQKDYDRAFKLYSEVATEGLTMITPNDFAFYGAALEGLSACYRKGRGVQMNESEAQKLYNFDRFITTFDDWNAKWRQINP